MVRSLLLPLALIVTQLTPLKATAADLTQQQVDAMIKVIDQRQSAQGAFKAQFHLEWKAVGQSDVVLEGSLWRRDDGLDDRRLVLLFDKPKAERGKGYLRLNHNLWYYDVTVGRWERRTERARIAGTNSRRSDLDSWNLQSNYSARFLGDQKVGALMAHQLELKVRGGADVPFFLVHLWVGDDMNPVKRQEYTASQKLLRTTFFLHWKKVFSEEKKADIWYPEETRIYEDVGTPDTTLLRMTDPDVSKLETNVFTKAWLESKSL